MTTCRGTKIQNKNKCKIKIRNGNFIPFNYHPKVRRSHLTGKRIPYLTTNPKHHNGNKYTFQFQGSGGFDLKQRVKESCSLYKEIRGKT